MTIVAVPCAHRGAVDLIDNRYPADERLHFPAGEWREFLAAVKAGQFDRAGDSAGAPPGSGEGAEDVPGPKFRPRTGLTDAAEVNVHHRAASAK